MKLELINECFKKLTLGHEHEHNHHHNVTGVGNDNSGLCYFILCFFHIGVLGQITFCCLGFSGTHCLWMFL